LNVPSLIVTIKPLHRGATGADNLKLRDNEYVECQCASDKLDETSR